MSDAILGVAAYVCLVLGVTLLVVRLFGERLRLTAGVLRFRLRLRRLDGVPTEWTKAMGAMEHLQDEPARRNRPVARRQHTNHHRGTPQKG